MTGSTFTFGFSNLKLTVKQIEEMLGYNGETPDAHFSQLIEQLLVKASEISDMRAEYRLFEHAIFNENEKSVTISDISFNLNKIIWGQLKRSDSVALFLCTAGDGIGKLGRSLMKSGDILEGYILDIIGSEAVESAIDIMQDQISMEAASEGLKITNRFSPGYCGWDVSEQHKLFHLLPGTWCGVKLTASALMVPEKSVSGIIGIGKEVRYLPYKCNLCNMKDCIYRKHRK